MFVWDGCVACERQLFHSLTRVREECVSVWLQTTQYPSSPSVSFTYCGLRGRPRIFTNCVPSWPFKPRLRWVCRHTCALCELTQCTTGTLSSLENVCAALIPVKQKHIQSSIKTHILLLVIPDESALFETHIFHTFLKGKCVCSTKHICKNNRRCVCSCTTCHHYAMLLIGVFCDAVAKMFLLVARALLSCSRWVLTKS